MYTYPYVGVYMGQNDYATRAEITLATTTISIISTCDGLALSSQAATTDYSNNLRGRPPMNASLLEADYRTQSHQHTRSFPGVSKFSLHRKLYSLSTGLGVKTAQSYRGWRFKVCVAWLKTQCGAVTVVMDSFVWQFYMIVDS